MLHLNTSTAEEQIGYLPLVNEVRIERHWPQTVKIFVSERQPWGYWQVADTRYVIDSEGVVLADIPETASERARELAIAAYRAIDCAGLARIDFFYTRDGSLFLNEVNTIPGFTPMSMYPKLWEHAGLSYRDLISRLIELALERHSEKGRGI